MRQVITTRRTRNTWRPELVLARGPQTLAQTGDGSLTALYGRAWALGLYKDGPQLMQEVTGSWVNVNDPAALGELASPGLRHVSLAFDQAARPVIAWERDGAVYVRQWNPSAQAYSTRGPWPGRDPLLIADAVHGAPMTDSDVIVVYLYGANLLSRAQREMYGVAHVLAAVPPGAVLDQVVSHPQVWQLLGEADGAAIAWVSNLYPYQAGDGALATIQAPSGGELFEVVIVREFQDGVMSAATAPSGGELFEAVILRDFQDVVTSTATAPSGGELLDVVVLFASAPDSLVVGMSAPSGGSLV